MLKLDGVAAEIEGVQVLRGVDMAVPPGSAVALVGRNGAGKTTVLRAVMGFVPVRAGRIVLDGEDLAAHPAKDRARLGIGYAPEDRRLFAAFTVEQNILLPGEVCRLPPAVMRERLDLMYEVLPELKALASRGAASLSGGQGKMVALGRALMVGSRLVLLDEPFQGLAPALAHRFAEALRRLTRMGRGFALVVTESNPRLLQGIAELTYTIERGEVALTEDRREAPNPGAGPGADPGAGPEAAASIPRR